MITASQTSANTAPISQSSFGKTFSSLSLSVENTHIAGGGFDYDAVSVDISLNQSSDSAETSGTKALNILKQTVANARAFPKQMARDKLAVALAQFDLIKLMGGTKNAKLLVDLAKRIGDASKQYAAGEQELARQPTTDLTNLAGTAQSQTAPLSLTRSQIQSQTPPQSREDAAGAAEATPAADSAAQYDKLLEGVADAMHEDDFYAAAHRVLTQIRKMLRHLLPQQLASPVKRIRDEAHKLAATFNKAVDDVDSSERDFVAAQPAAEDTEATQGIVEDKNDMLGSLLQPDGLAAQLLNLSV